MLSALVISVIWGRSASPGNVWIRPTAASTSARASFMSVPDRISTLTDAMPGAATDLTAFTLPSPSTSSSILATMASSTSSGVAPG